MPKAYAYTIWVEGRPVPKGRPRMTRRGRVFTPQSTIDRERLIAQTWLDAGFPVIEGPVSVTVELVQEGEWITVTPLEEGRASKLRGDVDNYAKLALDGLNGVAYPDDKKVLEVHAYKLEPDE